MIECKMQRDDQQLLAAVVRGDREAFRHLYERHRKAGYSLARFITRDRNLAEDAFQEAMASVWSSAKRFRPGNARAWILRIVACRSAKLKEKQRSELRKLQRCRANRPQEDAWNSLKKPERSRELKHCLREALERMDQQDRILVGLYFGAGLSQEMISAELDIVQRTVSQRLHRILGHLRSRLREAGFNSGAAVLSGELIAASPTVNPPMW